MGLAFTERFEELIIDVVDDAWFDAQFQTFH